MAIIRSYVNGFEVVDRTDDLLIIPNQWGLINRLGLFVEEGISTHSVTIEQIDKSLALIGDKVRGARASVNKDYTRKMHSFPMPHFPLDDAILPADIQGKRAFGSPEREEELASVRGRKMERMRYDHAATLEAARAQALVAGTVYAPNGTVSVDWYSSFGISRTTVGFALTTPTTDVKGKVETVIADIQDKVLSGEIPSEIVFLCSPGFFAALTAHANVLAAYQYYSSSQEPLRNRLVGSLGANVREFVWAGARFIEYRGSYNGTALIPTDEAYAFPMGTMDSFVTYFGPANKMDLVNSVGRPAYFFEYADPKGSMIEIESETNFINMLRRPACVVKCTKI
jgi:Phage major capsid protein E